MRIAHILTTVALFLVVVPSRTGVRVSVLSGFNFRRR